MVTQIQRARDLRVSRWRYQGWEQDDSVLSEKVISILEWCRLQRWRANKSQVALAMELGITRVWLNKMENGSAPFRGLLVHWEFDKKKRNQEIKIVEDDDERGT